MNELEKSILKWQTRASRRKEDGVFITEGIRMFMEIPEERLIHILVSESFSQGNPEAMEAVRNKQVRSGAELRIVRDEVFRKLSDTLTPQGILAVVRAFCYTQEDILNTGNGLFILLENLQDPGNLGTILRSAEASGASGVIMNGTCVDIYNPKVIRATMGACFRVKFCIVQDLTDTVRSIQARGGRVYAAHLQGAVPYDKNDYTQMSAFMIGNEAEGLSDALTSQGDGRIIIPMQGEVESLNAAMAATILLFEAARQRRNI